MSSSVSQVAIINAAALAPVGALAAQMAGIGSIAGQDPKLVGAIAGAAAGYYYGTTIDSPWLDAQDTLDQQGNLIAAGFAALGYLYGPQYVQYPPLYCAVGGFAAGYAFVKYALPSLLAPAKTSS